MEQGGVAWQCVNAACARGMPHKVRFCPYCGTAQETTGVSATAAALAGAAAPAATAGAAHPQARAASQPRPAGTEARAARGLPVDGHAPGAVSDGGGDTGAASASARGKGTAPAGPDRAMHGVPRPPSGPGPAGARGAGTQRRPVRLRTLVAVFVVLWLVWTWTKPDKFAARVEQAVTLASVCNTSAARKELAALEADQASPRQLDRIRAALAKAQPACEPEPAARGSSKSRPSRRPEAGQRADATATRAAPPPAPSAQTSAAQTSAAQSARTLILEARRAIASGNYRAAINRMDVCITMVDPVPQECRTLRLSAEYQQQSMERCLASGADWVGDHCE